MIKKGQLDGAVQQVDSSYVIKNDGTIEASLTFVADVIDLGEFPNIDDEHPEDFRLQCYNKNVTYGAGDLVTCTTSYFGIEGTKTEPIVSYDGGTNNDPSIVSRPGIGRKTFYKPPNVKNYLLVDMPYRTQGNLYQVTEQYMGSSSGGWNRTIY